MIDKIKLKYFEKNKDIEERHRIFQFYFFRPISFYLTLFFLRYGVSANQATYISIIFSFLGFIFLIFGGYWNRICGLLFLHFWLLMDNVDGNIARYCNSSTQYGKLIDMLNDSVFHFFYFTISIGLFLKPDTFIYLLNNFIYVEFNFILIIIGSLASLMSVMRALIYNKFVNEFHKSLDYEFFNKIHRNKRNVFYLITTSDTVLPLFLLSSIINLTSCLLIFYTCIHTLILFALILNIVSTIKKAI